MATIKDIARIAGVSHGTVSNVINKRGNVSAKKILMVEKAIEEIGYNINIQASQLRAQISNKIVLILPKLSLKKYNDFYQGVLQMLKNSSYEVELFLTEYISNKQIEDIKKIIASNPVAIIVASNININLLDLENYNTYFFEHKCDDLPYINFDLYEAGKEMAQDCIDKGNENVAIAVSFKEKNLFLDGIRETFDKNNIAYSIFEKSIESEIHIAFNIATSSDKFNVIITEEIEMAENVTNLSEFNKSKELAKIYSLSGISILADDNIKTYQLNYQLAGRLIAEHIINKKILKDDLILKNNGFTRDYKVNKISKNKTIKILALSSPTIEILKKMLNDFKEKTGINVKIDDFPYEEALEKASENNKTRKYDIIRLDVMLLEHFAKKVFFDLSSISEQLVDVFNKIPNIIPDDYFMSDGKVYALPLDVSVQLLYYRKDFFTNNLIRRNFYEKYKKELLPPKTYKDFRNISRFFTKKYNKYSPTSFGTNMVYGKSMVAASDYLPRLIAAKGLNMESGKIIVDEGIYKKTFQDYLELLKYSDNITDYWWQQSMEKLVNGDIAMCIVYSNHSIKISRELNSDYMSKVGFYSVPHNMPLLGGGVIGIAKESGNIKESVEFLKWIYSDKISNICTYLGGFIVNQHVFENQKILQAYPWIETLKDCFKSGNRRFLHSDAPINNYLFERQLGKVIKLVLKDEITIEESYILLSGYLDKM